MDDEHLLLGGPLVASHAEGVLSLVHDGVGRSTVNSLVLSG